MEPKKLDLTKEYGLVLEGGGAKGSYQIGVWKALREAGIHIRGIAGTSVGSLNGALICMDDLEKAEYIWENITYSQVMDLPQQWMQFMETRDFSKLTPSDMLSQAKQFLKDGGVDITPLKELLDSAVDEDKIRRSPRELYVSTYSITDRKGMSVDVRQAPRGAIRDMLLASSYLPVFKPEKLQGKRFMDGGGFNNVPIDVLMDRGYKDIIVIRIYGIGFDRGRFLKIPEDVNVITIAPRQNLGGILEFDKKKAKRNIKLGYFDAIRQLEGLYGKHYYIRADRPELYYFERMLSELELILPWLEERFDITCAKPGEEKPGCRYYTEQALPGLASFYQLDGDWNYKDLYLAVIESMARKQRINRFEVVSLETLAQKVLKDTFHFAKVVL